jgi:hypothetical protein
MRSIALLGFLLAALGCGGRATIDAELGGSGGVGAGGSGGANAGANGGADADAGTGGVCAPIPCPNQFLLGLQLLVTSDGVSELADVQVTLSGPVTIAFRCAAHGDGMLCLPSSGGQAGSYLLQVTAPGFDPVGTPATVTFNPAPRCGCQGARLAPSSVTLKPAP